MPTAIQYHFINITGYVGIPLTLRYSGVWRHNVKIGEGPQWSLIPGSDVVDLQDVGNGLVRIVPTQEGKIGVLAIGEDNVEALYWIKVMPFVVIAGFGILQKIGAIIECVQFGDEPSLPVLPPYVPPEE